MKLIYIDVETTGIECPESGLLQLAGAIEIDGQVAQEFNHRMRPFPADKICEEALEVNGLTREKVLEFDDPVDVFGRFKNILDRYVDRYDRADKFHFVAYNAVFDANHLRAWFEKNNDVYFGSWFFHPPIDVMGLAAVVLMNKRSSLPDFKLVTVAKVLGVKVDETKLHDAAYDIRLTREMYQILLEKIDGV